MAEPSRAVSKEIEEHHKTHRSLKSSKEEAEAIEKQYSTSARGMSKGHTPMCSTVLKGR